MKRKEALKVAEEKLQKRLNIVNAWRAAKMAEILKLVPLNIIWQEFCDLLNMKR